MARVQGVPQGSALGRLLLNGLFYLIEATSV